MSVLSLFFAICLTLRIFQLSWLFPKRRKHAQEVPDNSALAEIEGGVPETDGRAWTSWSVFEHIEQGLRKNPNGPAVISTFQRADCLRYLKSGEEKPPHSNARRQQTIHKNSSVLSSGFHEQQDDPHIRVVHAKGQPNGLNDSGELKNSMQSSATNPNCLILSYSQLHRAALKLSAGLIANGAQPYSTMLMLIPNSGEYTVLLWTCILLRITYVSLDPAALDVAGFTALKRTLRTLKPQLVVVEDAFSGKALDLAVSELQLAQPIRLCILPSQTADWKSLANIATDAVRYPIDEAMLITTARRDSPRRIHSIIFTSGTSGDPKGCPMRVASMSHVLHSQSWLIDSEAGAFALQQAHNSRGIAPAQTLQTWKAGGAVVMTRQSFDVRAVAETIRNFSVTFIVMTPPMVHEMANELVARPLDVSSVKRIQIGGDAVTRGVLDRCVALFPQSQVCVNHGMTEGGGSFIWPYFGNLVADVSIFGEICTIGAVAPGSRIRIWDTEKKRVAQRGDLGELHISCASIIQHYLESRSEESFYEDEKGRWFKTGDVAMINKDGLVFILGRTKDMIRRAGMIVMPAAIESSLEAFTGKQVRRIRFNC